MKQKLEIALSVYEKLLDISKERVVPFYVYALRIANLFLF